MDNQINEYTQLGFRFFSFLSMTAIKNSNDKYILKVQKYQLGFLIFEKLNILNMYHHHFTMKILIQTR